MWLDPDLGHLIIARNSDKFVMDAEGNQIKRLDTNRRNIYIQEGANEPPPYRSVAQAEFVEAIQQALKDLNTWNFQNKTYPLLVLGWVLAQVFLGALEYRPTLWIHGSFQSGKSHLLTYIKGLFGGYAWLAPSGTASSAAGVLQSLKRAGFPCLLDEGENNATEIGDRQHLLRLIELSRVGYSAKGESRKGTADQRGKTTSANVSFAFVAIAELGLEPADLSRAIRVFTAKNEKWSENGRADPPKPVEDVDQIIFWGMVKRWPIYRNHLRRIKEVWNQLTLGDAREPDTYGTALAAITASGLFGDDVDVEGFVKHVVQELQEQLTDNRADSSDADALLTTLCSRPVRLELDDGDRVNARTSSVAEIVGAIAARVLDNVSARDERDSLARNAGLGVIERQGELYLAIPKSNATLAKLLSGTRWGSDKAWVGSVKQLLGPTAKAEPAHIGGTKLRCYQIPIKQLPIDLDGMIAQYQANKATEEKAKAIINNGMMPRPFAL